MKVLQLKKQEDRILFGSKLEKVFNSRVIERFSTLWQKKQVP